MDLDACNQTRVGLCEANAWPVVTLLQSLFLFFFCFICLFLGHTGYLSRTTPSFLLRNHSGRLTRLSVIYAKDQTWSVVYKANSLPTVIAPASPILLFYFRMTLLFDVGLMLAEVSGRLIKRERGERQFPKKRIYRYLPSYLYHLERGRLESPMLCKEVKSILDIIQAFSHRKKLGGDKKWSKRWVLFGSIEKYEREYKRE